MGYWAIVTDASLEEAIIIKAVESLEKDPDRFIEPRKSLDDKTTGRDYFHSSCSKSIAILSTNIPKSPCTKKDALSSRRKDAPRLRKMSL